MAARRWTQKGSIHHASRKERILLYLERDECAAAGFSHEPPLILLHVSNEKIPAYTYL